MTRGTPIWWITITLLLLIVVVTYCAGVWLTYYQTTKRIEAGRDPYQYPAGTAVLGGVILGILFAGIGLFLMAFYFGEFVLDRSTMVSGFMIGLTSGIGEELAYARARRRCEHLRQQSPAADTPASRDA